VTGPPSLSSFCPQVLLSRGYSRLVDLSGAEQGGLAFEGTGEEAGGSWAGRVGRKGGGGGVRLREGWWWWWWWWCHSSLAWHRPGGGYQPVCHQLGTPCC
jgi:hypothetical protein